MAMVFVSGLDGVQNASQGWVTAWEREGRTWRYATPEELRELWAKARRK